MEETLIYLIWRVSKEVGSKNGIKALPITRGKRKNGRGEKKQQKTRVAICKQGKLLYPSHLGK